jgi:sulfotransferase family protein
MTLRERVPPPLKAPLRPPKRVYRRGTSGGRALPEAIIIGAAKSGTTALFSYLTANPSIVRGEEKEVHFFDRDYGRGPAWYRAQFPKRRELRKLAARSGVQPVVCEATPYYLAHPLVPSRVHGLLPDVKLIALLRDPVERAVSHYHHNVQIGYERLPMREALDAEPERLQGEVTRILSEPLYRSFTHQHNSYLERGRYAEQLERWLSVFREEQLLVLDASEFFTDATVTVKRVCRFLGVEDRALPSYPPVGAREYPAIDSELKQRLEAYFAPHNERLWDLLGTRFSWG